MQSESLQAECNRYMQSAMIRCKANRYMQSAIVTCKAQILPSISNYPSVVPPPHNSFRLSPVPKARCPTHFKRCTNKSLLKHPQRRTNNFLAPQHSVRFPSQKNDYSVIPQVRTVPKDATTIDSAIAFRKQHRLTKSCLFENTTRVLYG
jgi:hypothetical protein